MNKLSCLLILLLMFGSIGSAQQVIIKSPDRNLVFTFSLENAVKESGCLFYSLSYKDKNVILKSRLGIITKDLPDWTNNFTFVNSTEKSVDERWVAVYGERKNIRNYYNECSVNLLKEADTNRRFRINIRVYNEGAAFSYFFPENYATAILNIADEKNEFTFEDGAKAYVTPFAQEHYHLTPLKDWTYENLSEPLYARRFPVYESERPLTLILKNGLFVSLAEAECINYSRMKFILSTEKENTILSKLFGPVVESSAFKTPWRVIMVAEKAKDLIGNNDIILNLNPPNEIKNTDWIKPGKVIREVTLSTKGAKECIDFCAKRKIEYIEFDAGWYGLEFSKESDASRVDVDPRRNPKKDLDLNEVISYAKANNVGVILYVNHQALEQQLDEILPIYRQWGIAGLKFGFVHVGSHKWTSWLHEAVRKAAKYNLMVDIHDEYRPTGFSRTYPNLLTQEGIYGNECMPDANHNTTVPFTRFLAGAADYTICYYHQTQIKNIARGIKTTSAHQMGLSVIFYSPFQFVYWYDKPSDYRGEPEVEFFDHLPTVWDTTKVISGEIGQYISIARKSGEKWFLGCITNNDARKMEIPLDFLDKDKKYTANIYSDGGDEINTRTHVKIERYIVNYSTKIRADLKPSGGIALEIVPANEDEIKKIKKYK
jgi:alpha-glucosidase